MADSRRDALTEALAGLDDGARPHRVEALLKPTSAMIDAACAAVPVSRIQAQIVYEIMLRASLPGRDEAHTG